VEFEMSNLLEITCQESGIIIYDDEVIVTNWASYNSGLPLMSPFGTVIEWPDDEPLKVIKEYNVDDVRDVLPGALVATEEDGETFLEYEGMEVLYDLNGDIPALWGYDIGLGTVINTDENGNFAPTSGKVYHVNNDVIVIAPHGWN
jgi:hypothetical protein